MRWVFGVVGAAAVLGALFGLTLPLSLQVVDRSGLPIACGTGFHPDHYRATREDAANQELHDSFGAPYEPSDYTAQCDAIVSTRRSISVSVIAFGGALLGTTFLLSLRAAGHLTLPRRNDRQRRADSTTPLAKRANPWLDPKASPPPDRYRDDLNRVLSNIGIRVQH